MRLWPWQMLPILPNKQLLGQHRECCALRGNGWGKKHATVDYIFEYSYLRLYEYHMLVLEEFKKRGFKADEKWKRASYRGQNCEEWPQRIVDLVDSFSDGHYPEHNEDYYNECVKNLADKGHALFIEMAKKRIRLFNHTGHVLLWDWLSKNPSKDKHEWPGWARNGGKYEYVFCYCFACDKSGGNCGDKCRLVWDSKENYPSCHSEDSSYEKWNYSTLSTRKRAAECIRDLPVRKDVLYY